MRQLDKELADRKAFLKSLVRKMKRELKKMPEGRLYITKSHGTSQYRILDPDTDYKPIYISKSNNKQARIIAQRDYYIKALNDVLNEIDIIEKMIALRDTDKVEERYSKQRESLRELITPLTLSDEEYARRWQAIEYEHKAFFPDDDVYISRRNEKMRSKSEVIIADILDELGIPYRYEYPVTLENGRVVYVDFLILDVRNRKEIYYEHFGRMGDKRYADSNVIRFNNLVEAGLIPGDNFIASFETADEHLNTTAIRKILEPYAAND